MSPWQIKLNVSSQNKMPLEIHEAGGFIVPPGQSHHYDSWDSSYAAALNAVPPKMASPQPLLLARAPSFIDQPQTPQVSGPARDIIVDTRETLPDFVLELNRLRSKQSENTSVPRPPHNGLPEERGSPTNPTSQGIPPELANLLAEIIFVLVCTAGQVIQSLTFGHITVVQIGFREALGIAPAQAPWLIGSAMLASGLSVIISGPLADLAPPRLLMIGAFLWEAVWNAVTAVAISPRLKILFFVARAMQGLAVGVLVSTPLSILGRVYNPGIRKTRVFSLMAAGAPLGFWIGCVQGGALSAHLPWIFGSTSILLGLCAIAAHFTIPNLPPAKDSTATSVPSVRQFDYVGALLASLGSGLLLFGLTQGSAAEWNPYTYSMIILGFLLLVMFHFVERRVTRPLIPNGLWRTRGFAALLISYVFGFGAYSNSPIISDSRQGSQTNFWRVL